MDKEIIEEVWEDIIGYKGIYKISNFGKVKSLTRNRIGNGIKVFTTKERILKPSLMGKKRNYKGVLLSINGKSKCFKIHRLVGIYFIPNPQNKPEINHLDGDTLNNHYKNLVWNTTKENINHAWGTGLSKPHHKNHYKDLGKLNKVNNSIAVFNINTKCFYSSLKDASKITKTSFALISRHINNKVKSPIWTKIK